MGPFSHKGVTKTHTHKQIRRQTFLAFPGKLTFRSDRSRTKSLFFWGKACCVIRAKPIKLCVFVCF